MLAQAFFLACIAASILAASTPGQTSSSECTPAVGTCTTDGSSNYVNRTGLSYNTATGKFSGDMVTNQCPQQFGNLVGGIPMPPTMECVKQTFPAYGAGAAPLRGVAGLSLYGVNIYGPMEAGFTTGQACTNGLGSCDAGVDVPTCENTLERTCGTAYLQSSMFLDDCGGHASPYHFHKDLSCEYPIPGAGLGHSAMTGIALDGYGFYGLYETTGVAPTNLDFCGGHVGDVPATTVGGITYPAATNVYHYHAQDKPPYTIGCFGGGGGVATTLSQCKTFYPTCDDVFTTYCTSLGEIIYDKDCPCFQGGSQAGTTQSYTLNPTAACPNCKGACASASPSPSVGSSVSPSPNSYSNTKTVTPTRSVTRSVTPTPVSISGTPSPTATPVSVSLSTSNIATPSKSTGSAAALAAMGSATPSPIDFQLGVGIGVGIGVPAFLLSILACVFALRGKHPHEKVGADKLLNDDTQAVKRTSYDLEAQTRTPDTASQTSSTGSSASGSKSASKSRASGSGQSSSNSSSGSS